MWNVPVRFLVMWSPILVVSIGGVIYAAECTQTLMSPGTGFQMEYPTKDGALKIECKTYSFDPFQQTLIIDRLVIHNNDGKLLARAPHIVVTGLVADDGFAPKLQLKDAELWVTRDAKGDLDVLNLFPKSEGSSAAQPWQVSVRDSILHLTDQTVPGGAKNDLLVDTGNFVGMGNNVEGGGSVRIPGLMQGQLGFKKSDRQTTITGRQLSSYLGPTLARLRAGHERKLIESANPLQIASGMATGDFSMVIANDKPTFLSNMTVKAVSPRWKGSDGTVYQADNVDFVGSISDTGLAGKAVIRDKKLVADASGNLGYGKKTVLAANVQVRGVTPAYLGQFKLKLPKEVAFTEGGAKGYLTFQNGKLGWKGAASVTAANVYGLKFAHLDSDVTLNGDQLLATLRPTQVGATMVEGNFGLNLKSKAILGSFSTPQLNANDFSKWLPTNVLDSKAKLVGLIDGTLSKPKILVKGTLDPRIKLADRTLAFNSADVVLRFDGNQFSLDRLALTDEAGSLYASGTIDFKKGMNVRVVGNNISLAKLAADSTGKLDVQGLVTGKLSDPHYVGKMQGYQIGYKDIPGNIVAVASDFSGDKKGIRLQDLDAMKGASQITGSIGIGFEDQKLAGLFAVNGIEVSDLYDGPVGGVLDLKDVTLAGTFAKPQLSGSFDAKKILAYNFAVDSAKGKVAFDGEKVRITESSAQMSKGSISDISADFTLKSKAGNVSGKFQKLDLSDISQTILHNAENANEDLKVLSSRLAIKGSTSGSFNLGFDNATFSSLTSKGRVDDVLVNKAAMGSGDWTVGYDGTSWTGDAFIGSLDEYFRIDNALYKPSSGSIGGEFLSYQIPLKELIVATEPSLKLSQSNQDRLEKVSGKLGVLAKFSGTADRPVVEIPDFEINNIKLAETDIGNFSVKANYGNGVFDITDGLLLGPKQNKVVLPFVGKVTLPDNLAIPDGTAKLSGKITDFNSDLTKIGEGNFNISASIYGFPISKFEPLMPPTASGAPTLANIDLFVDQASLNLKGKLDRPSFTGNVQLSAGMLPEGKKPTTGFLASKLKFATDIGITPDKDGLNHLISNGTFKFNSIEGTLKSDLFLTSNFGLDNAAPLKISADLNGDRDVSDFFRQSDGIVLGENGAHLRGGFEIGNTFAAPSYKGGLTFNVDSLKSTTPQPIIGPGKSIDTVLRDVVASVNIEHDDKTGYAIRTKVSTSTNYSKLNAKDAETGSVAIDAKLPMPELTSNVWDNFVLANREVEGSVAFKNLGIYQSFMQNTFAQATIFTEDGKPIRLAGTLGKPKISGSIFFDDVRTIIPTLNATPGTSSTSAFDPDLDLKFYANNPISIKSSLASIQAKGSGSVKGTLSNLQADGALTVISGDLLLPGGNVKLSPDGTLVLKYDNSAYNPHATLDANLHGETSLTVLKNGLTPERYDIFLDVKGDLLASDTLGPTDPTQYGLTDRKEIFSATSVPGDLDQSRILQLLGRYDIIESVLQSGVNSNVKDELKNAGIGFALPTLFGGITSELAKTFHLDYVGVDYNAFEQTSVSVVKNLGNGFFLQGRQQVMQPLPGQPALYDYRLAYRPRRGPNSIRALSFSLGTDQQRPYKFSIDYTSRVRTRKPPYQTIKLYVPNK